MTENNTTTKKVFRLQGLSFKEELEGKKIDFTERILYLSLVPWEFCNWSCLFCHEDRRQKEDGELSIQEMTHIICEGADLGIKSMLLLGGEVLLNKTWEITRQLAQTAFDRDIITVVYTNGSQLTQDMALWLADRNVSLAFKVDTLNEQKYDTFTQRQGSFKSTMRAIELARKTSIGEVVCENKREKLVRLLFTTVGNAWNIDEYVSLAQFATNHGARWMMESLNHRGDVCHNSGLAIDEKVHSEAMKIAIGLNPEQNHAFKVPCRLLSCVTIRKKGEIGICPQDYKFLGNIRTCGNLAAAVQLVRQRVNQEKFYQSWNGRCPIKQTELILE